jgi:ribose/xylose/arabinose/galactoside ABC-type transport system permease subunit
MTDSDSGPTGTRSLRTSWQALVASGGLIYIGLVVLVVAFSFASPVFLSAENFANIGRQTTLVSIMAVGMALVIISGEFDLSVGSVMALAGVFAALAMKEVGHSWMIGGMVALATGAFVGMINGVITVKLAMPSFLITLGTLSIARGIALLVTGTRPVNILSDDYIMIFGEGYVVGIPVPIVWTVVVAIGGVLLLHFTTFGRKVYATGGNTTAARYSGINTDYVKVITLTLTGMLAGLAAMVLTARSHASRPDAGFGIELDVIAAVILGGAALGGGTGTIIGALVGSLIIGVLNNGLNLVGVDPSLQLAVKGLIIWIAIALSKRRKR